ncbi:MAG: IS4 family transposase [Acidobacteria bacterium]|nr:IS4 family transposase [Acidobacteriota bacterium]
MNLGKTLFAQVMACVPWTSFGRIVDRYSGNSGVRTFPCTEQFRAMAFAQLTWRDSLRDVEACLAAHPSRLYGMGFRQPVRRSTLADANERRDWRIWAELAEVLIRRARVLYGGEDLGLDLRNAVYALDSTTIDLCLSLFEWAPYKSTKAAIKVHTLLDLRGSIPSFIHITNGKTGDVEVLDLLPIEAGAFYVMDRGYIDFGRLYALGQRGGFFVTRAKSTMDSRRVRSMPCDRALGIRCDQRVALNGYYISRKYPEHLRRIRYVDPETGKNLVFLTNHMTLPALTICALYKQRWRVELFFKWIKHHLRIKRFMGTSENAVKTQIWCAIATYVLIAIVKKEFRLEASLHTLLQVLSVSIFEKTELGSAFASVSEGVLEANIPKQLTMLEI